MDDEYEISNSEASLLTPEEVRQMLSVSRSSIYRWMSTGELGSFRIGALRRIHPDQLRNFMIRGEYQLENQ